MIFSSATFLMAFLPLFMVLYFAMPWRPIKNLILLGASLVFYAWGEPVYVLLMIASILVNWALALGLSRRQGIARKAALVVCVIVNLCALGFFKYEPFLAQNINAIIGRSVIPQLKLALPVGISFYTLQALTYVVDVYRREVPPQTNPLLLGMYITMFPQLVAGPIVRYSDVQEQIENRNETYAGFVAGHRLFVVGLAKKVLLANIVAILSTHVMSLQGDALGLVGSWGGLAAYTFQIYFDFSGYSDMAIGLGRMMGFDFPRNFYYPYVAQSVTDFWRRWHISLSSFFRDYVYIPLGGNRVSKPRWVLNLSVVWLLTGIWHGAAWNYILWGLYYLALLLCEKLLWGAALARAPRIVRHLYTGLAFMFGWLLFWCEDLSLLKPYVLALVGRYGLSGTSTVWELTVWEYLPVFALCLVAATPIVPWLKVQLIAWANGASPTSDGVPPRHHAKASTSKSGDVKKDFLSTKELCDYEGALLERLESASRSKVLIVRMVLFVCDGLLVCLLALSVCSIAAGSFNPFIYFRF